MATMEDRAPRYYNELQGHLYTLIEDDVIVPAKECYQALGKARATFYTWINGTAPTPPLLARNLYKQFRDIRFMDKYIDGTGLAYQLLPEAALALQDTHTERMEAMQATLDAIKAGLDTDKRTMRKLIDRAHQELEEYAAAHGLEADKDAAA